MRKSFLILIIFSFILSGCEPDDICLEGNESTPEMIIMFYDVNNPNTRKDVIGLKVMGIENELELYNETTDSIAIPLKTTVSSTGFVFIKTENNTTLEDQLTVDYNSFDTFINRACGFKRNFNNLAISIDNPSNWIINYEIITDTISDIKESHVKILH